jgi:RNA polymerase sigma factor (TIGR02999 family)
MKPHEFTITELLAAWRTGDRAALEKLVTLLYPELRRLARRHMSRQPPGHTLQTTELLNEAYLRLTHLRGTEWRDRLHFLAVASRAMRSILVDHARRRQQAKRGGAVVRVTLSEGTVSPNSSAVDASALEVIALDAALGRLEKLDPQTSQIVELRYFGGLTVEETATVVGISPATVKREWCRARAWLSRDLASSRDV